MAWWWSPSKHTKKIVWSSEEVIVRQIVLTPLEPRRATLVERDTKDDKWFDRVKC